MASITTSKNGKVRILFYGADGRRRIVHLNRCSKDFAVEMKARIERLQTAVLTGDLPKADAVWIATNPHWKNEFIALGILEGEPQPIAAEPTVKTSTDMTVSKFLVMYMDREAAAKKPSTTVVWNQVVAQLEKTMGSVKLRDVTVGHAKRFKTDLEQRKLATTTIYKRVQFAKQFFQYAVDWKLIDTNPFKAVKNLKPKKRSNVDVPVETIEQVLAVCDTTWKAIVALSRFGGLRCPSETLSIKWGDIDFENKRMFIPEPKVEHHDGRGRRECRLFDDLEPYLVDLFNEASEQLGRPPSQEAYVIDKPTYRAAAQRKTGWANANLRTMFLRLLERAGVKPWPRLFHSMRASCQTELEEQFPTHVVCKWIGNTEAIAKDHYLLIKESHFTRPMRPRSVLNCARAGVKTGQNERCDDHATTTQEEIPTKENIGKTAFSPVIATHLQIMEVENRGLEPLTSCMPCKRSPN